MGNVFSEIVDKGKEAAGFVMNPVAAIGTGLGIADSVYTNKQNKAIAREQMAFQAKEAAKARDFNASQAEILRDWQTSMANTAVSRRVADLEDAGLNPILAISQGQGATTPGGSALGSPGSPGGAGIPAIKSFGDMASTAVSFMSVLNNVQKIEAETRKLNAEANIKEGEEPRADLKEKIMLDITGALAEGWQGLKGEFREFRDALRDRALETPTQNFHFHNQIQTPDNNRMNRGY